MSLINDRKKQLINKISFGVTPAMATPLTDDVRQINLPAVDRLVDFLIGAGVKGLFVGGTTGEGILLSVEQRRSLHERAMKAIAGRVPALIHVGSNTTAESVELTQHAASIRADAVVAVTPTFYPMPDEALAGYFAAVSEAAPDIPLLAYDIPHMAVNGISPGLLASMAQDIPAFAGVKSSNQDAQAIRRLIDVSPVNSIVLAGNERIALGSLSMGAAGLISGLATAVPGPFVNLTEAFFAWDIARAQVEQRRINALLDLIPAGTRIGALKSLLVQRGIEVGPPVPPRPALAADAWPGWSEFARLLD
jgi:dihydrodipicolinate synthase/N-acetylneuraminate lyase